MFRNLIKRKRHPSPRVGSDQDQVEKEWLTRGFVIKMVLIVALVGPVMATLISPFFDQTIRNTVDEWMSEPDLFDSISIGPEEYIQLPLFWRQALAEIALRPKEEAVDAQSIIEELTLDDLELIGLLAPYTTNYGILRDNSKLSEHPMPELSYSDFSHLEDLGILEDVNNGMKYTLSGNWAPDASASLLGMTVYLKFGTTNIRKKFDLEVTAFTRGGKQIFDALRVPSRVAYFEWFARVLEERGFAVELFAMSTGVDGVSEPFELQGRIERESIPEWLPSASSLQN